nr:HAD-IA family hydrolase [Rhodococcus sp. (in: high G+C Gram-positive bacteria)]
MTAPGETTETVTAQALLFDMDGTLVDSQASIEAVWFEFADRHGVERERVAEVLPGRIAPDIIAAILGPTADVAAELAWIRRCEDLNSTPVHAVSGAPEFLSSLPADRWAVVTAAPRAMMIRRLEAAGLPIPTLAICAEDVSAGKPDPQGFLAAARQLGVPIGSCVVFEDSAAGMTAAARAGAACIAIGDETGEHALRAEHFGELRITIDASSVLTIAHTGVSARSADNAAVR